LAAIVTFGWLTWSHVGLNVGFVPNPIDALALVAVVAGAWLAESGSEGWAFTSAAVAIGSVVASIFFDLFPRVMVSSTNAAYNLTVSNASSPSYTLRVMTVVAVVAFPVVLVYQGWTFWVFRKRISSGPEPTPVSKSGGERRPVTAAPNSDPG
jgi:cytochrome d ubiquinol oxidase subunit II